MQQLMRKFVTRPLVVEAIQFETNNEVGSPHMDAIVNRINQGRSEMGAWHNGTSIYIQKTSSILRVEVGEWIIKDKEGNLTSCEPDIFQKTYIEDKTND